MSTPGMLLPPGFRFHPTDEELILHYLSNRAASLPCPVSIVAEVDIYKFDPWDLPAKATFGDGEWYFFSPRERKYPNGYRPNRTAASGYWKATGIDKPVVSSSGNACIGVKKALVFYKGRPPRGVKTNWIMHEYRLAEAPSKNSYKPRDLSMKLDDWVLCRIYKKNSSSSSSESSAVEDVFIPTPSITTHESLSELLDAADYSDVLGPENCHNIDSRIHSSSLPRNLKRQWVADGNEVLSSPAKRTTGSGIDTDLIDDLEFDLCNPPL